MAHAWHIDGLVVESKGRHSGCIVIQQDSPGKILPWDSDIDVQMSFDTLSFLASYYNMSIFNFEIPNLRGIRSYLLEINPQFDVDESYDKLNMIEARCVPGLVHLRAPSEPPPRWIDMKAGLFIDVTTVRMNETASKEGSGSVMRSKDLHHYLVLCLKAGSELCSTGVGR